MPSNQNFLIMSTFNIQDQVYHRIGSLLPVPQQEAPFLQIYFVSEDEGEACLRDVKRGLIK